MSAIKSGSSLRCLVLTPERIPAFFIPCRSPLLFPPLGPHRSSADRTRLLSDHDDASPGLSSPGASHRSLLRLPPRIRRPGRAAAAEPDRTQDADTDLTTRAAMSLPHVGKVTTPYGFRAVLAASPCTRRRESLFHQNKAVTDLQDQADSPAAPGPRPRPGRSPLCVRPGEAGRT